MANQMMNLTEFIEQNGGRLGGNNLIYLYCTTSGDLESIIKTINKHPNFTGHDKVGFIRGHDSFDGEFQGSSLSQIAERLIRLEFGCDFSALGVLQDDEKYILTQPQMSKTSDVQKFLDRVFKGEQEPHLKSAVEAPDHKEPLCPGVVRLTASNFKQEVVEGGEDIFIQEFADWCPWCPLMHPYTNDLAWVMSDVKNVKVCKIDCAANDTRGAQSWLQSDGIPNLLFLPASKKKNPKSFRKIGFGDSGEDNDVNHRVDAMVAFIYRHMSGEKFDEDAYKKKAKLIQGEIGFLAEKAKALGGNNTSKRWIDVLRGEKQGDGPRRKYLGCPCWDVENGLTKEWSKALNAAVAWDHKHTDESYNAVELVKTKMMHEMFTEKMGEEDWQHALKEFEELRARTEECHEDDVWLPEAASRTVYFQFDQVRILLIDTTQFQFRVCFSMYMEWQLKQEDARIHAEDNKMWTPPMLMICNALEDEAALGESTVTSLNIFMKDSGPCKGQFWAMERRYLTCTCSEVFELQNFPFDVQQLQMFLTFQASKEEHWTLERKQGSPMVEYSVLNGLAEWEMHPPICELFHQNHGILHHGVDFTEVDKAKKAMENPDQDIRPALVVKFIAQRGTGQFLWSVGYIIAGLGIMGNCVFLLDPIEDYSDRIGNILTLFLASCAFQTVVDSCLPKLRYISLFQLYLVSTNTLIFAMLAEVWLSKYFLIEDDQILMLANGFVWLALQMGFLLLVSLKVMPEERQKMSLMTPRKVLSGLSSGGGVSYIDDDDAKDGESDRHVWGYTRKHGLEDIFAEDPGHGIIRMYVSKQKGASVKHHRLMQKAFAPTALRKAEMREAAAVHDNGAKMPTQMTEEVTCTGKPDVVFYANKQHKEAEPREEAERSLISSQYVAWWQSKDAGEMKLIPKEDFEPTWNSVFQKLDSNNNGTLEKEEALQLINAAAPEMASTMKDSDFNQDGIVSKEEWAQMLDKLYKEIGQPSAGLVEHLELLMKKLEEDRSKTKASGKNASQNQKIRAQEGKLDKQHGGGKKKQSVKSISKKKS